ncbi:tachylectin-related carbohydrate-binding protein [Amycolatopsis nigrescens]|uniref:tachylectin-related carbohydrate-binding protein n=1 Tax=Amycolatopsis nigrescens TaxID=381445 RepID=UPI0009FC4C1F|nr:tachylectin-related carbohydrate-binding protein [Amycolatopsis nigrescens]
MSSPRSTARRATALASLVLATTSMAAAPASAISGGAPAADRSHRFVAKVTVGDQSCTGALVAPQWLLTAASCFADTPDQGFHIPAGPPRQRSTAVIGRTILSQDDGQVVAITDLVPRDGRDLTLAKLATPVTGITPVPVTRTAPKAGEELLVAGYGRTSTEWVPDRLHTATFTARELTDTTFTITGKDPATASTCRGDAGGPALRDTNGNVELVAINSVSWQGGCIGETETRTGSTEARVDDLGDWIRRHVPDLAIECAAAAPVFTTRGDGSMWLYQHTDPRNGSFSWINDNGQAIGSGWLGTRAVAAPGGVVYQANSNGELRRFRWNGTTWDLNTGPTPYYQVIDGGWGRYATAEYRNRITVDTTGHIYTIEPDGNLHRRTYDPATGNWNHRVLKDGWAKYDLIVAAGDGVLYARTPNGELFRFVYNATSGEWTQWAKPSGTGWNTFKTIMSVGGDVLYGSHPDENGGLLWYRHLPASDTWAPTGRNQGKLIGTGWYDLYDMTAAPDTCRLTP